MKKKLTILTPCFNEEGNVDELHQRIHDVMVKLPYDYEHLIIDNCSTDGTVDKLRALAAADPHVKLILNVRNFGHIRSPYYGLLQSTGDACIAIVSDLQDPPELIPLLVEQWEKGFKVVMMVKPTAAESWPKSYLRRSYYQLISGISDVALIQNATGAGLYDQKVLEVLRKIDDPYPYFRGLICEIGYPIALIPFHQPMRKHGITKNNFYSLYDLAMLGITNHSKVPLRLMTMGGFLLAFLSMLVAFLFLIAKLAFWNNFSLGIAPILIGMFFFFSVQIFLIGMLGEYVGAIYTYVRKRPLVVEAERINFANDKPDHTEK